ncbi:MAG: DUF1289 domain-containing protein, partial [Pseudomonadota bacterium]
CKLDLSGNCQGCLRTKAEITDWMKYSPAQRAAIMAALESRRLSPSD